MGTLLLFVWNVSSYLFTICFNTIITLYAFKFFTFLCTDILILNYFPKRVWIEHIKLNWISLRKWFSCYQVTQKVEFQNNFSFFCNPVLFDYLWPCKQVVGVGKLEQHNHDSVTTAIDGHTDQSNGDNPGTGLVFLPLDEADSKKVVNAIDSFKSALSVYPVTKITSWFWFIPALCYERYKWCPHYLFKGSGHYW